MKKPRPARVATTWLLPLAAPLVWFAHFNALYGIHAFAKLPRDGLLGFDAIAWALTVLACVAIAIGWQGARRSLSARSEAKRGAGEMAGWLAVLSLAGILFQGLALVLVSG
jgi:hypothetical protein